jgi:hypothetical protein
MTSFAPTSPHIEWRLAGKHLWLGETEGGHVGVIENDQGYAAIDAAGTLRGVYASLVQAQLALAADADDR